VGDLNELEARLGDQVRRAPFILARDGPPMPTVIEHVSPGRHTACAVRAPALDQASSGGVFQISMTDEDPVACTPIDVAPTPEQQTATIAGP
jgi:hypothetical protein